MDTIRLASIILAALELVPGEPWDLTEILRSPTELAALLDPSHGDGQRQLTRYLREGLASDRADVWQERLEYLSHSPGVRPLIAGEPGYPQRLLDCWDAPPLLFVRGSLPTRMGVAIVGSRKPSAETLGHATAMAAEVAAAGLVVVSGLAAGIDSAAHTGALRAGGLTVAVMGTGIEQVFPKENARLADQIATTGALVSQFAPDAPRTGTTFLRRNKVIAGLAAISLIMEGRERSGSRHELEQAISYGRRVLLWQPTMESEQWASDLVSSDLAHFVSTPHEVIKLAVESTLCESITQPK